MATTQEKWAERVRAWRSSGKTAEEFASEFDFEPSTLRYWSSRLKSAGSSAAVTPIETAAKRARIQPTAMIARVVSPASSSLAVVTPNGLRIEGVALEDVVALVRALG